MGRIKWYVVFTDEGVQRHWVHRFLKADFLHCYCFRQIGDYIYYVNPSTANIDSKIYEEMSISDLAQWCNGYPSARVLEFEYTFDFNNRMVNIWNLVPTCVSVVKMFLGISCRAQTPYQLYKYLLTKGAKSINH